MRTQKSGPTIWNGEAAERFNVYEISLIPDGRLDSRRQGNPSRMLNTSNWRSVNPQLSNSFVVASTNPASKRRSLKINSASGEIVESATFNEATSCGKGLPLPCRKSKAYLARNKL